MVDITSPPASRLRQPRWLDARLLVGVGLVLLSVLLGTWVVAGATQGHQVWQVGTDLAAGTRLTEDDLSAVDVRLPGSAAKYVDATGAKPVGWVLSRDVGAGELLPRSALVAPDAAAERWRVVTVPVQRFHYPGDLAKGERVDVYVTVEPAPGAPKAAPELVLRAVTVARVDSPGSGLGAAGLAQVGVELAVPVQDAAELVRAAQVGALDLVRVPSTVGGTP